MAGNKMGALRRKLGMKGPQKPGAMIARMNEMNRKTVATKKKLTVQGVENTVGAPFRMAGQLARGFARNVTGGDIKSYLKKGSKSRLNLPNSVWYNKRHLPSTGRLERFEPKKNGKK